MHCYACAINYNLKNIIFTMKSCLNLIVNRRLFCSTATIVSNIPKYPELDFDYLCNPSNFYEIRENVVRRKGIGNIELIHDLKRKLDSMRPTNVDYGKVKHSLYAECKNIPNKTHPSVFNYQEAPKVIKVISEPRQFHFKPQEFHEIGKRLNFIRMGQLGNLSGSRSYYLLGELAEMEHALVQYTLNFLIQKNFQIVTVSDILHRDIIESCGLNTSGERTQVYHLDKDNFASELCLSGTAEMALAGQLMNKVFKVEELPLKLATVSRCFRAETSSIADEKGIYRVHEFTKVEVFIATKEEDSDSTLEYIKSIEEDLFNDLGLHMHILDMPPSELGAPAYRKYDIEAWMPGRKIYGEISSCSNCTNYQSIRLNIKYQDGPNLKYVHTLNGTACAIPRMLIALVETYQNDNGTITIPSPLKRFMRNKDLITRQKKVPELKLIKNKK